MPREICTFLNYASSDEDTEISDIEDTDTDSTDISPINLGRVFHEATTEEAIAGQLLRNVESPTIHAHTFRLLDVMREITISNNPLINDSREAFPRRPELMQELHAFFQRCKSLRIGR